MVQSSQSDTSAIRLVKNQRSQTDTALASDSYEAVSARLPMVLQTTLDISELITLFNTECQKVLAQDSLAFSHTSSGTDLQLGIQRHHATHYRLEIDQQHLGDITLTRRQRFPEAEILLIEDLLCKLVYPLRNAIRFQQAYQHALTDTLTGLANRYAFDQSLQREIDLAKRRDSPLALIVLDLDHFKAINDTHGHSIGDNVLKQLSDSIRETLRRSDICFRYGGEEFVVILSDTDLQAAWFVAERLRQAVLKLQFASSHSTFNLSISAGVSIHRPGDDIFSIFDRADHALFKAKAAGRNQVKSF